jgi:hypothetical protein
LQSIVLKSQRMAQKTKQSWGIVVYRQAVFIFMIVFSYLLL